MTEPTEESPDAFAQFIGQLDETQRQFAEQAQAWQRQMQTQMQNMFAFPLPGFSWLDRTDDRGRWPHLDMFFGSERSYMDLYEASCELASITAEMSVLIDKTWFDGDIGPDDSAEPGAPCRMPGGARSAGRPRTSAFGTRGASNQGATLRV